MPTFCSRKLLKAEFFFAEFGGWRVIGGGWCSHRVTPVTYLKCSFSPVGSGVYRMSIIVVYSFVCSFVVRPVFYTKTE